MRGNPFDTGTTVMQPTSVRIRVEEAAAGAAKLAVELVDAKGVPVVTLHREPMFVGESLTLQNVQVNLEVVIKE